MPNKLHIVSLMALLDAVHADGVAVCCVTGVTPRGRGRGSTRWTQVSSRWRLRVISKRKMVGRWLPVKIVHWIAGVTGNLVQALTSADSLLDSILIVHDFIICRGRERREGSGLSMPSRPIHSTGFNSSVTHLWIEQPLFFRSPFIVTLTPDARNNPPKRLLKIWLPSNVAVAWFVISMPVRETQSQPLVQILHRLNTNNNFIWSLIDWTQIIISFDLSSIEYK